jgi:hypothetical protein
MSVQPLHAAQPAPIPMLDLKSEQALFLVTLLGHAFLSRLLGHVSR